MLDTVIHTGVLPIRRFLNDDLLCSANVGLPCMSLGCDHESGICRRCRSVAWRGATHNSRKKISAIRSGCLCTASFPPGAAVVYDLL